MLEFCISLLLCFIKKQGRVLKYLKNKYLITSNYYKTVTHVHEVSHAMSFNLNSLLNKVVEDKQTKEDLNGHEDVVRTVVVLE